MSELFNVGEYVLYKSVQNVSGRCELAKSG